MAVGETAETIRHFSPFSQKGYLRSPKIASIFRTWAPHIVPERGEKLLTAGCRRVLRRVSVRPRARQRLLRRPRRRDQVHRSASARSGRRSGRLRHDPSSPLPRHPHAPFPLRGGAPRPPAGFVGWHKGIDHGAISDGGTAIGLQTRNPTLERLRPRSGLRIRATD